jgi:hypothetical protein
MLADMEHRNGGLFLGWKHMSKRMQEIVPGIAWFRDINHLNTGVYFT